jgi:hypothetical protein
MNRFQAFFLFVACVAALPAAAGCRWEWFCNGEGACKQMPLCDSIYERPPPKPDTQPPAMPPISMRPYKIPGPMGTLTCEHIMRQETNGKWRWIEMCFCTDPARSKDATPPFAHIVRCDTPYKE